MWNKVIDKEYWYLNVEKIFPTQQMDVYTIISKFSINPEVKQIIVFGSSVTSACNPWSDIDVYVELDSEIYLRAPRLVVPVDLWTNYDVDERLLAEITDTGVVVYERE